MSKASSKNLKDSNVSTVRPNPSGPKTVPKDQSSDATHAWEEEHSASGTYAVGCARAHGQADREPQRHACCQVPRSHRPFSHAEAAFQGQGVSEALVARRGFEIIFWHQDFRFRRGDCPYVVAL